MHAPKKLRPSGPYSSSLNQIRNHDYGCDVVLPNDVPKSLECGREWSLSSNISVRFLKAIDVVSVDVALCPLFVIPTTRQTIAHTTQPTTTVAAAGIA